MPQAATITANDRESTPVAHTFAPRQVSTGVAQFVESNSVPIGEKVLTIRSERRGTRYHSRVTLAAPVLVTETVNGVAVPTVPRAALIDCHFRFDNTSIGQERKNTVGMFVNSLVSGGIADKVITDLEGVW